MAAEQQMLEQGPVDGSDRKVLTCRQRWSRFIRDWPLHDLVRPYVVQAGFYGLYRVGFIQLDWALITALVERWRQETHTFHLAVGESTVTLQDVAVLLGLRIHGDPVTGTCDVHWDDLCEELLGLRPNVESLEGSSLKVTWLRENFLQPPEGADDATVKRYARAYILALVGGALFADKSGSSVQVAFLPLLRDFMVTERLSWGSAALAHLYRELCRASQSGAMEIAGPLTLLQLWAWERLHVGRPGAQFPAQRHIVPEAGNEREAPHDFGDAPVVGAIEEQALPVDPRGCRWKGRFSHTDNPQGGLTLYRDQLDQQKNDQIIWQPYTPEILEKLPPICVADQQIWRTVAPLICFEIVEWHHPDRVLRQFGLRQGIPDTCDTEKELHKIDRRGRHRCNWRRYHAHYIRLWEQREQSIVTAVPNEHPMDYHDPYMEWYRSITHIRNMCSDVLHTIGEEHQLQLIENGEPRALARIRSPPLSAQRRRRASGREYQAMSLPPQPLVAPRLVINAADHEPLQSIQEGASTSNNLSSTSTNLRGQGRGRTRDGGLAMISLAPSSSSMSQPPRFVPQSAGTATTNNRQSQGQGRDRARGGRSRNP
ncbi:hypothetical protein AAG906_027930 [Vitis piasezkii]